MDYRSLVDSEHEGVLEDDMDSDERGRLILAGQLVGLRDARRRLDFAEWWSVPLDDHPWLTLLDPSSLESFEAWWSYGEPVGPWGAHRPSIEVRGLVPPPGACLDLPAKVDAVGRWALRGLPAAEAGRWIALGALSPTSAVLRASSALSVLGEVGGGSGLLASDEWGRSSLSDACFDLFDILLGAGVDLGELAYKVRDVVSCLGGEAQGAVTRLESWLALIRDHPSEYADSFSMAHAWMSSDFSFEEARQWCEAGFSDPYEVERLVSRGFTPEDAPYEWRIDDWRSSIGLFPVREGADRPPVPPGWFDG
ncbi:MAG: hypothetical protein ACRDY2_03445 [Acidimicrobiales bacterium]